jgi:hypothetical protein
MGTRIALAALVAVAPDASAHKRSRVHKLATVRASATNAAPVQPVPPAPPEPTVLSPATPETAVRLDSPPPAPQRRWGLFAGGMTLFAAGYAVDLGLSFGLGVDRAALSLIPVFGPLAQLGSNYHVVAPSNTGNASIDTQANARIDSINHATQTVAYVVLSVDCALQLAGAVMAVTGVLPRRTRTERPTRVALGRGLSVVF